MGISYVLIAQFLLYFGVVNLFNRYSIHPVAAGLISAVGGFAIGATIDAITQAQYGISLLDLLILPQTLVQLLLQIIIGVGTFGLLKKYDDSISASLAIATAGGILLFFVAPYIAPQIAGIF